MSKIITFRYTDPHKLPAQEYDKWMLFRDRGRRFWMNETRETERLFPGYCKACATMSPDQMREWEYAQVDFKGHSDRCADRRVLNANILNLSIRDFSDLMIAVFDPEFMRSLWSDKDELR